MIRKAWTGFN